MSKLNPKDYLKLAHQIIQQGFDMGVGHLAHASHEWNGKYMHINHQNLVNLGTCGYLGLETDQRLIDRSVDLTKRYGTQFSISRVFVFSDELRKLEEKIGQMFDGHKALVTSSTTLIHLCVLPIIVTPKDAVIFDQQAHFSVQNAIQILATRRVHIQKLPHNQMQKLAEMLSEMSQKFERIWYMIDGVYSMFGDFAPLAAINHLMEQFPKLHIYCDDAHGVGWAGKNGTGTFYNGITHKDRLILSTTLAKGFGATGGVAVFPNKRHYDQVEVFGGPLSYSHPLAPAIIGAADAACDIFLSDEIEDMQAELTEKINYVNTLLEGQPFPIMSHPRSPIKYIGIGTTDAAYKLNKRIIDDGYFCNSSTFPVVPLPYGGIRFTITRHIDKEDILGFVETVKKHYWEVLEEENTSLEEVRAAFHLPPLTEKEGQRV